MSEYLYRVISPILFLLFYLFSIFFSTYHADWVKDGSKHSRSDSLKYFQTFSANEKKNKKIAHVFNIKFYLCTIKT